MESLHLEVGHPPLSKCSSSSLSFTDDQDQDAEVPEAPPCEPSQPPSQEPSD